LGFKRFYCGFLKDFQLSRGQHTGGGAGFWSLVGAWSGSKRKGAGARRWDGGRGHLRTDGSWGFEGCGKYRRQISKIIKFK